MDKMQVAVAVDSNINSTVYNIKVKNQQYFRHPVSTQQYLILNLCKS